MDSPIDIVLHEIIRGSQRLCFSSVEPSWLLFWLGVPALSNLSRSKFFVCWSNELSLLRALSPADSKLLLFHDSTSAKKMDPQLDENLESLSFLMKL